MNYLIEFKSYYKEGDLVLIEYWYNDMITVVKILERNKNSFKVTHNINQSQIFNAPDEVIKSSDIIDIYRD